MLRKLVITTSLLLSSLLGLAGDRSEAGKGNVKFAWGASLDGAVDLSGNDMSTIGIDGYFGVSMPRVQMAGIGTSLNIPVSNSNRMIPVYAIVQTNFSMRPRLCFLDVRGGLSVNYLQAENGHAETNHTGAYTSVSLGFNLAGNSKFQSFMTVGYSFFDRKPMASDGVTIPADDLHMVTMRLGVRF